MSAVVNVNGRVFDQEHAVISVFDHGFLYGEGVYETLRTYNGEPFLFDRHMWRLRKSAEMLTLTVPLSDADIDRRFRETMHAASLGAGDGSSEAYIRILVTRGVGELSYDPAACHEPSVVVIVKPHVDPAPEVFAQGVTVALVPIVRNHPGSVNPLIKSNNLLNNALAMQEAFRRGAFEGVMRNYRGELAECTTANLFIVKDGVALTPPLAAGLLAGLTREFLFEVGTDIGVHVRERTLKDGDLFGADEAFLTSTTREVVPIVKVDDRVIGSGKPGETTKALLAGYRKRAYATHPRTSARTSVQSELSSGAVGRPELQLGCLCARASRPVSCLCRCVQPRRLRRLPTFSYTGPYRYHLILRAFSGQRVFIEAVLVELIVAQVLSTARSCGFAVIAYCVMPDHMHILVEGTRTSSDLPQFVQRAKQLSGFHGKRVLGAPIWQTGYFERVLREWEDTRVVAAYILRNPVRAGLVVNPEDYPFNGSGVGTCAELLESVGDVQE